MADKLPLYALCKTSTCDPDCPTLKVSFILELVCTACRANMLKGAKFIQTGAHKLKTRLRANLVTIDARTLKQYSFGGVWYREPDNMTCLPISDGMKQFSMQHHFN